MTPLAHDLLALEKQFWNGNADFYRNNLDDSCLVVFTKMAGPMKKEQVAGMAKDGQNKWKDLNLDLKGLIEPAHDFALLSYHATGTRLDGTHHDANVSTGYVKRDGAWKMTFHQQSPIDAKH